MSSWVHLFSRFTPELLLFEALLIFMLLAGYAAFYVLRRRRFGSMDETVPKGVVQAYLNALIQDAERMRVQLFGLLQGASLGIGPGMPQGIDAAQMLAQLSAASGAAGGTPDPALLQKLQALEAKMLEQNTALEAIGGEKKKLEEEIAKLRAAQGSGAGATAGSPSDPDVSDLKSKLEQLESRLAEYSIIEDDLANLKRLQQENAQLKAALGGKAPAAALEPAAEPAPPPLVAAPEAVVPEPAAPQLPELSAAADAPNAQAEAAFEGLVDQVEASLQPAPAAPVLSAEVAPAPVEAAPAPTETAAPPIEASKTDADLVAEFEKMLNA